jgi:ubiquinone/menaquinone biosynthesis C-methylase UbiE
MSLFEKIVSQFSRPRGIFGHLAGFIMAKRSSNIERSRWAISVLGLKPTDCVLEIGFGPGVSIQHMTKIITKGTIYGIDHSELMVNKASKANKKALAEGRVRLVHTSILNLPNFEEKLDKVLDINSFQFWDNPVEALKGVKSKIKPGGLIALVQQPRRPGASEQDTDSDGKKFANHLKNAGFSKIKIEKRIMKPVPTVCVIGVNE